MACWINFHICLSSMNLEHEHILDKEQTVGLHYFSRSINSFPISVQDQGFAAHTEFL